MNRKSAREAAQKVIELLHKAGHEAYLAGGCVRDLLLKVTPKDYDVVTDARPDQVVALFKRTEQVGAKFGVVLVRLGGQQIEVATFRADQGYSDGRHPDAVTFGDSHSDAARRDFSINGMFYDIRTNTVIDFVDGQRDLQDRVIRAIGDPDLRFAEDHLRMLRAARFAARLDFALETACFEAIRRHAAKLPRISAERVREELKLILTHSTRVRGWRIIVETALVNHIVPDLEWSLEQMDGVGRRLKALPDETSFVLTLAAVLRPHGPERAEAACERLRSPNSEAAAVAWLLRKLALVQKPESLELADLKMLMADARFGDLTWLLRADLVARNHDANTFDRLVDRAASIPADEVAPPRFVTGEDLLTRGIPQGPAYGRILDLIYRAQLNGDVNGRGAALRLLEELVTKRD